MVGLTPKQKEELNIAILEYLTKNQFARSVEFFMQEANIQSPDSSGGTQNTNSRGGALTKDILENKWTTVVKLKK